MILQSREYVSEPKVLPAFKSANSHSWLGEGRNREVVSTFLVVGCHFYAPISLFNIGFVYREISRMYPRLVKDGCEQLLVITVSFFLALFWPLWLVFCGIASILQCFCIDTESCCGCSWERKRQEFAKTSYITRPASEPTVG